MSFVTLLLLHTHCFILWAVFLCWVLSPNSTFFDQGCVHHPHVSIAFDKDKHRQETCVMSILCVRLCVCALYESEFISNTWFLLGVQLRAKTLLVGVCVRIDVGLRVR